MDVHTTDPPALAAGSETPQRGADHAPLTTLPVDSLDDILCEAKALNQKATHLLQTFAFNEPSTAEDLLRRTQSWNPPNLSSTTYTKIAIAGDSGQGKSSLINSLLNLPDIAVTGCTGASCTSIITEYRNGYEGKYALEVEYLPESQTISIVTQLVAIYRRFHLGELTSIDDELKAKHAWNVLKQMFGHYHVFNKEFLQNPGKEAEDNILHQLSAWISEIHLAGRSTKIELSEAILKAKIQEYMLKTAPFIKLLRVYVNSDILRRGLVLVDLPACHDDNLIGAQSVEQYINSCDFTFIVTRIGRALSDPFLKMLIPKLVRANAPSRPDELPRNMKLAIICTHTDEGDFKSLKEDLVGKNLLSSDLMGYLDNRLQDAKQRNDRAAKKFFKQQQQSHIIQARNLHISDLLKDEYSTGIGQFQLFFISNRYHQKSLTEESSHWALNSGVSELHSFVRNARAWSQRQDVKCYFESRVPSFMSTIKELEEVEPDYSGNLGLLIELSENLQKDLAGKVHAAKKTFESAFRELIGDLDRRMPIWTADAVSRYKIWAEWDDEKFGFWCTHHGFPFIAGGTSVNWNAELTWKMKSELAYAWELFEEDIPELFSALLTDAKESFEGFCDITKDFVPRDIWNALCSHISSLYAKIKEQESLFTEDIKILRQRAFSERSDAFIFWVMVPLYHQVSQNIRKRRIIEPAVRDILLRSIVMFVNQAFARILAVAFDTTIPISLFADSGLDSYPDPVSSSSSHPPHSLPVLISRIGTGTPDYRLLLNAITPAASVFQPIKDIIMLLQQEIALGLTRTARSVSYKKSAAASESSRGPMPVRAKDAPGTDPAEAEACTFGVGVSELEAGWAALQARLASADVRDQKEDRSRSENQDAAMASRLASEGEDEELRMSRWFSSDGDDLIPDLDLLVPSVSLIN